MLNVFKKPTIATGDSERRRRQPGFQDHDLVKIRLAIPRYTNLWKYGQIVILGISHDNIEQVLDAEVRYK
jgi:hypothetical protein